MRAEHEAIVAKFVVDQELEPIAQKYAKLVSKIVGVRIDGGFAETPEIIELRRQRAEIEAEYGDKLRAYTEPYLRIPTRSSGPIDGSADTWARWYTARALEPSQNKS